MTALPGNGRFRNFSTEIAIGASPMEGSVEKFLNGALSLNPVCTSLTTWIL